jgi:predicted Rossmann fold nucleotide-binding protein DprA/Smf involved in DNA uptake
VKVKIAGIALSLTVTALAALASTAGYAQDAGTTATDATQSSAQTPAQTKAQKKAAQKQARAQARAKKNAELKKLEDAGYNPSRANDPNYPQDLQNAQKKAGLGAGGSQ